MSLKFWRCGVPEPMKLDTGNLKLAFTVGFQDSSFEFQVSSFIFYRFVIASIFPIHLDSHSFVAVIPLLRVAGYALRVKISDGTRNPKPATLNFVNEQL
jgi:hypothetical protein